MNEGAGELRVSKTLFYVTGQIQSEEESDGKRKNIRIFLPGMRI